MMRNRSMAVLRRHWRRFAVTLLPLVLGTLHITGVLHLHVLERLDQIIYDTRLRATMPMSRDDRIVIVDIDEKSLATLGQWPWSRDRLAALTKELFERQQVSVLGFDVVFAEADTSSGLKTLEQLAGGALRAQPAFREQLARLAPALDYDGLFARSLTGRPAVLGYYLTSDREGRTQGVLPPPVLTESQLRGLPLKATRWDGYGSNIAKLADAAPSAGFFNSITDADGIVRSLPLLAEHGGRYYESLALAMFRTAMGQPEVHPGFATPQPRGSSDALRSVVLRQDGRSLELAVDDRLAVLIPFRGPGTASGGSFRYISASDVIEGTLGPLELQDALVLVGSTAPALQDLRATPVGKTYPGVETHANVLSAFLEGRSIARPDYADAFDVVQLACTGVLLAVALPVLTASAAVWLSVGVIGLLVGTNVWLYVEHGLALPLATAVTMSLLAFALNMGYGYFVESRSKRELAALFGTYVPPELVGEMVKEPGKYSMQATNREMTVMFCDMRGFTAMSEKMEPQQLQRLLNDVFSQLTRIIRAHKGTIDKYMGDCVMAFWGAPVATPDHATLAVQASLEMVSAIARINTAHRQQGLPEIGVGIGLNSGLMFVGDMGSDIRRSYTVIGDSVNLASRLEGLSKHYGGAIVASESTVRLTPQITWQQLDHVRVKGQTRSVRIYQPADPQVEPGTHQTEELGIWQSFLTAYAGQHWTECATLLQSLRTHRPDSVLYACYEERLHRLQAQPFDPGWDAVVHFETK